MNQKIKVAVGMSGGVDSSVSAYLLKKQALRLERSGSKSYEVVGLFMKLWHDPACDISRENACCDDRALADAQKVAEKIGIPLYVVDARKEFKDFVTDYFVDEYKNLRTPNPCIVCNRRIKFGWLLDFAKKIGCEYLATGHYARIVKTGMDSRLNRRQTKCIISTERGASGEIYLQDLSTIVRDDKGKGVCHLLKGSDSTRDQSYFLHQLDQEQLSQILFPVGEMTKDKVRKIAKEAKLPVFEKVESREICFVPDDYRAFLKRHLGENYFKPGLIVNKAGFTVGKHNGMANYTIGQRRSVNQESRIMNKGENRKPLYVIGFNRQKNQLIVGEEKDLYKEEFEIGQMYWVNPENEPRIMNKELRDITVKIRYKAEEVSCDLTMIHDSSFLIQTAKPVRAATPGQSAVLCYGEEVLGGGIIAS